MDERLEKYRLVGNHEFATKKGDPFGMFLIPTIPGQPPLRVMCSPLEKEYEWEHVSVSLPNRTPTWAEMCKIKDLFWDSETMAVQYHPKLSEAVNNHPYCLHIWVYNGLINFPSPPSSMVGIKDIGPML